MLLHRHEGPGPGAKEGRVAANWVANCNACQGQEHALTTAGAEVAATSWAAAEAGGCVGAGVAAVAAPPLPVTASSVPVAPERGMLELPVQLWRMGVPAGEAGPPAKMRLRAEAERAEAGMATLKAALSVLPVLAAATSDTAWREGPLVPAVEAI